MFGLNTQELLIIFLIILLLFGANRIPEVGRALGRGIRDFKRATRDVEDHIQGRDEAPPKRIVKEPEEPAKPENSTRS
jgi:TatA/E family protein of Tat protein translocase